MSHDVFISYSSHDRPVADAICERLEAAGVLCWIAPRDILPGDTYGGAIIRAITEATIMLLVFSERANTSPQILREVERAVSREVAVLPVRIDDAKPSDELEYFISSHQWLDALPPPPTQHLDRITSVVQRVLAARSERAGTASAPPEPERETPRDAERARPGGPQSGPPPDTPTSPPVRAHPAPALAPPHWSQMSSLKARLLMYPATAALMLIALVIWLQARASWEARNEGTLLEDTTAVVPIQETTPIVTDPPAGAASYATLPTTIFLDPNTASLEDLMALPGISANLAGRLIVGRPYADMRGVDAVLREQQLDEAQRNNVYVYLWKPLDLNSATAEEIELIPGVGPRMRHEFEGYRPYKTIEQFRSVIGRYVNEAEVARLLRYVTLGF